MTTEPKKIEGHYTCPQGNIAIVASRFNELVVSGLVTGAKDALLRHGVSASHIEVVYVPGAFEIPLACQQLAKTKRFAGIITLGAVIRGATAHFDYVASGCTNGVLQTQLAYNIPITFGVLTTENIEQALARAGCTVGNKGSEAALALIEMINLLSKIHAE